MKGGSITAQEDIEPTPSGVMEGALPNGGVVYGGWGEPVRRELHELVAAGAKVVLHEWTRRAQQVKVRQSWRSDDRGVRRAAGRRVRVHSGSRGDPGAADDADPPLAPSAFQRAWQPALRLTAFELDRLAEHCELRAAWLRGARAAA